MMSAPETIRMIIYPEGEYFLAQGLEIDICAQGKTAEEASQRFGIALNAECEEAARRGKDLFDIVGPAPTIFHTMYDESEVTRSTFNAPTAA